MIDSSNIDRNNNIVWTISSSDCCAGTGIQADLHTFHDFDCYGCSVITALAAQNSFTTGYTVATERKSLVAQINALDSDMPAAVIKVGMLPNRELLETVIKYLQDFDGFVVYDPELNHSASLLPDAAELLKAELLPRTDLLLVNTEEVQMLVDIDVDSAPAMTTAANSLLALGARAVLLTGARFDNLAGKRLDYWSDGQRGLWASVQTADNVNNRGGGSTLSAALAAAIARGHAIEEALRLAKAYVTQGIRQPNRLGGGPGSVAHLGLPRDDRDMPLIGPKLSVV